MCCITFKCPKTGGEPGFSLVGHPAVQGEKVLITHCAACLLLPEKGRPGNLKSLPASQFWGLSHGLVKKNCCKSCISCTRQCWGVRVVRCMPSAGGGGPRKAPQPWRRGVSVLEPLFQDLIELGLAQTLSVSLHRKRLVYFSLALC